MKYLRIVIVLILAFNLTSCSAQKNTHKKAITQLLESIYKNDSISEIHIYENDGRGGLKEPELTQYFHCMVRENGELLNADVTLISKPAKTFCYSLDINGIKAFVYIEGCNFNKKQYNAFYSVDEESWEFAIENIDNDFIFYELKRYPNIHNKKELYDNFKL
ncbi:hypothetical protein [Aquimarina pacifica]|uniref:hypothetical protein n=1 Tax=Aquimarina pacifica TaxID=1296415 RepID=UPI00046EB927|nr:hypothetical protein [Aquimarina pacifica]